MNESGVNILFAGDYHSYGEYIGVKGNFDNFIKRNPQHDLFDSELLEIIRDSDYSVFNLEDPISINKKGIDKYGPHGVGSIECLFPIQKAGFRLATFATNHTFDMGDEGIITTIEECNKRGIEVIGAGLTKKNAKRIFYKTINNISFAFLNYSRVEFNVATDVHGGANLIDTIDNTKDILEAKKNADFIFVVVHEGLDVNPLPYPALVKQMRFYADMGANAIVMHHSRVVSGYEIYNETPIFYGIGNIVHLTKNKVEHEGLFVKFNISTQKKLSFEIIPVELDSDKVIVRRANGRRGDEILKKVFKCSEIIKDNVRLKSEWNKYVLSRRELYMSIILGHPRVLYKVARKLKLLKVYYAMMTVGKRKYFSRLNLFRCGAHFEATKNVLTKLLEEGKK